MDNGHGQLFLRSALALYHSGNPPEDTLWVGGPIAMAHKAMAAPSFPSLLPQVVAAQPICLQNKPNSHPPPPPPEANIQVTSGKLTLQQCSGHKEILDICWF